ncbi:hypothetical protein [Amycolatopsis alkalitolerans]|nr:hypothetical protein [Amycolatopsis alkalitolerans]
MTKHEDAAPSSSTTRPFGGANGIGLAQACPDVSSLASAYRKVIST